jgi:hypothetical protein
MAARLFERWRLTLPLLLPGAGGLGYLAAFDAPVRLIAVNAGALALAAAWALWGRLPKGRSFRLALAALAVLALLLPLGLGPEAGGVRRWLPAGPLSLHTGSLLLPLVVVLAAREAWLGPALLALAGTALALQPDAAALLALGLATAVLAALRRSLAYGLVALSALALVAATWEAGTLAPQLYTEGVLAHVAAVAPAGAALLAGLLFLAPLWFRLAEPQIAQDEGLVLAGLLIGLSAAAVIAPFPFPLIGYGASPILGFGLALGAAALTRRQP